jgi:excisionase family DNA binding protein
MLSPYGGKQMENSLQTQEPQAVAPRFLPVKTVCQLTSLSRSTLFRHIKNGKVAHVKVGSRVLVAASFLDELKEKSEVKA